LSGGTSHPECYAGRLQQCSPIITDEHYISHSILRRIGVDDDPFRHPILCRSHNRKLGRLDEVAKRVFDALVDFEVEMRAPSGRFPNHRTVRVSGWDFERWFVKAYCGMNAARVVKDSGSIPDYMIDSLFRRQHLPLDLGLYFGEPLGATLWVGSKTLGFVTGVRPDTGEVCNLHMAFSGVGFYCSLRPMREGGTGVMDGRQHHFAGFTFKDGERLRALEFDWSPEVAKAKK
jgi:hypothetical protein